MRVPTLGAHCVAHPPLPPRQVQMHAGAVRVGLVGLVSPLVPPGVARCTAARPLVPVFAEAEYGGVAVLPPPEMWLGERVVLHCDKAVWCA